MSVCAIVCMPITLAKPILSTKSSKSTKLIKQDKNEEEEEEEERKMGREVIGTVNQSSKSFRTTDCAREAREREGEGKHAKMPKQHLTSNTKLIAFVLSWGVHRQIPVCDSFGDLSVLPFRPFACSPLNPGHFERNNKLMRAIAIAIHFSLVYLLCVLLIIIFIFGLFFYLLVS